MSIGWYVHHHGSGHLHRFLAVREQLGDDVVALSSLPRPDAVPAEGWIVLPGDVPEGEPDDPTAGGMLHWAPRGVPGLRERTAAIARWALAAEATTLVVDVSCEVAVLARLLSLRTVLVAQRGVRVDPAHALAAAGASAVLAPWTAAVHAPEDGLAGDRLVLTGMLSRFDGMPSPEDARTDTADAGVLLLVGAGGHRLRARDVHAAAAATPGRTWHVAGALRVPDGPGVRDHGARADVWALLHRVAVVVATGGGNAIAETAAARRPLVVLPQPRPFNEQLRHADHLAAAGLADVRVSWPDAGSWPDVLARAQSRDPTRWDLVHDGRGAVRMAAAVRAVAEGADPARAAAEVGACA